MHDESPEHGSVLHGLDAIAWASLEACRDAALIPELLHRVAGGDRREALSAAQLLFETICYQSSLFEATAAAVPFMGRIARAPWVPLAVRCRMMGDLVAIGHGQTFIEPSGAGRGLTAGEFESRLAVERGFVAAARTAVASEADLCVAILPMDDPAMERCVLALAHCSGRPGVAAAAQLSRIAGASGDDDDRRRRRWAIALAERGSELDELLAEEGLPPADDDGVFWRIYGVAEYWELTAAPDSFDQVWAEAQDGFGPVDVDTNQVHEPDRTHCVRRAGDDRWAVFYRLGDERLGAVEVDGEATACRLLRRRVWLSPDAEWSMHSPVDAFSTGLSVLVGIETDSPLRPGAVSRDERTVLRDYLGWLARIRYDPQGVPPDVMPPLVTWARAAFELGVFDSDGQLACELLLRLMEDDLCRQPDVIDVDAHLLRVGSITEMRSRLGTLG